MPAPTCEVLDSGFVLPGRSVVCWAVAELLVNLAPHFWTKFLFEASYVMLTFAYFNPGSQMRSDCQNLIFALTFLAFLDFNIHTITASKINFYKVVERLQYACPILSPLILGFTRQQCDFSWAFSCQIFAKNWSFLAKYTIVPSTCYIMSVFHNLFNSSGLVHFYSCLVIPIGMRALSISTNPKHCVINCFCFSYSSNDSYLHGVRLHLENRQQQQQQQKQQQILSFCNKTTKQHEKWYRVILKKCVGSHLIV